MSDPTVVTVSRPTVVTAAFCHDGWNEFVLLQRRYSCRDEVGRWDLVTGVLEFGLTAEQNVAKEIREELGTAPLELSFVGYADVFRIESPLPHCLRLDFIARVDPAKVHNAEPHKHYAIAWINYPATEAEPKHSQLNSFLTKYRTRIAAISEGFRTDAATGGVPQ